MPSPDAADSAFLDEFSASLSGDDIDGVEKLIASRAGESGYLNEGIFGCGIPALAAARSQKMVDVLLAAGADVESVSEWWAPGFGAQEAGVDIAEYLIEKGAILSPHAAAAIGLIDRLTEILDSDPGVVHAEGGDACRPLHFARDVAVARLLLDRGAEIDARDEDHESTAAQWRIKDAPGVTKFLIERGAEADIFMAAAFGDLELTKKLVSENPECTSYYIGNNNGPFPGIGFNRRGGTIYQWSLGFNRSPHEIAKDRGHDAVFEYLLEHTAPGPKLLVACAVSDRELAKSIVTEHPGIIGEYDDEDLALLAKLCWETNLNIGAVRLMLELGFPVDFPEKNHGFQALHNAAWCGRTDLVKLLLEHGHPVDTRDPDFNATALGFAIHSCTEAKRHPDGKFGEVTELLLKAGVPFDKVYYPVGDQAIDAVLKEHFKLE